MSKRTSVTVRPAARPSATRPPAIRPSTVAQALARKKEFTLPAFSTTFRRPETLPELAALRRKTVRRNAPPGENLTAIKRLLASLKGTATTVHEFIVLLGPSLADQGEGLRTAMNEDLATFRRLARKVYDMATQDNSDVMLNEQLQIAFFYSEQKTLLQERMMRALAEIHALAPNFDFDAYAANPRLHLEQQLPLPVDKNVEPEELEMMRRQAAYHRIQWLRSEGERLNAENNALRKRLHDMKQVHLAETRKMAEKERKVEDKRDQLEAAEANKQDELDSLNHSLEKEIIVNELTMRMKADAHVMKPAIKAAQEGAAGGKKKKQEMWTVCAAGEIEEQNIEDYRNRQKCSTSPPPFRTSPGYSPRH